MQECNVCVASASSSSELGLAPRPLSGSPYWSFNRSADAQQRARLDELADARRQLDEELDLLHQ
jgi:hypothetical protein